MDLDKARDLVEKHKDLFEKIASEGKFDETVTADTSNPVMTYEVTRLDTVLYSYQDSGH